MRSLDGIQVFQDTDPADVERLWDLCQVIKSSGRQQEYKDQKVGAFHLVYAPTSLTGLPGSSAYLIKAPGSAG